MSNHKTFEFPLYINEGTVLRANEEEQEENELSSELNKKSLSFIRNLGRTFDGATVLNDEDDYIGLAKPQKKKIINLGTISDFLSKSHIKNKNNVLVFLEYSVLGDGLIEDYFELIDELEELYTFLRFSVFYFPMNGLNFVPVKGHYIDLRKASLLKNSDVCGAIFFGNAHMLNQRKVRCLWENFNSINVSRIWILPILSEHKELLHQSGWEIYELNCVHKALLDYPHINQLNILLHTCRVITGALLREVIFTLQLPIYLEDFFWKQEFVCFQNGADWGQFATNFYLEDLEQKPENFFSKIPEHLISKLELIFYRHLAPFGNSVVHENKLHLYCLFQKFSIESLDLSEPTESLNFFDRLMVTFMFVEDRDRRDTVVSFLSRTLRTFDAFLDFLPNRLERVFKYTYSYLKYYYQYVDVPASYAEDVDKFVTHLHVIDAAPRTLSLCVGSSGVSLIDSSEKLGLFDVELFRFSDDSDAELDVMVEFLEEQSGKVKTIKYTTLSQALALNNDISKYRGNLIKVTTKSRVTEIKKRDLNEFYWAKSLTINNDGTLAENDVVTVFWPNSPKVFGGGWYENGYRSAWMKHNTKHSSLSKLAHPKLDEYGIYVEIYILSESFRMRLIPAGSFLMGSPISEEEREEDELQHPVKLTKSFWLAETLVPLSMYKKFNSRHVNRVRIAQSDIAQYPVENISCTQAKAFCNYLNKKTGLDGWTLPSEAQWEYACRAGEVKPFNTGIQLTTKQANFNGASYMKGKYLDRSELLSQRYRKSLVQIDEFEPNSWGLKQMHGNLSEWCRDEPRKYTRKLAVDPVGKLGEAKFSSLRGGSYSQCAAHCRSAKRDKLKHNETSFRAGIRLCFQ